MRQCQVPGCTHDANYEVFLSDFPAAPGRDGANTRYDRTCLFICEQHAAENEEQARESSATLKYPDYPEYPFCSRRCKTIDLGRWLGEGYRVPDRSDDDRSTPGEGETNAVR